MEKNPQGGGGGLENTTQLWNVIGLMVENEICILVHDSWTTGDKDQSDFGPNQFQLWNIEENTQK